MYMSFLLRFSFSTSHVSFCEVMLTERKKERMFFPLTFFILFIKLFVRSQWFGKLIVTFDISSNSGILVVSMKPHLETRCFGTFR